MDPEILVHVKASSRYTDDKRYVTIAQGVLDFEPVRLTKFTTDGDNHKNITEEFILTSPDRSNDQTSLSVQDSIQYSSEVKVRARRLSRPTVVPTAPTTMQGRYGITKSLLTSRRAQVRAKTENPPFKSPLRDGSSSRVLHVSASATPPAADTRAASEDNIQILVPNTERRHDNRTKLDISSDLRSEPIAVGDSRFASFANLNLAERLVFTRSELQPVESSTRHDSVSTEWEAIPNDKCPIKSPPGQVSASFVESRLLTRQPHLECAMNRETKERMVPTNPRDWSQSFSESTDTTSLTKGRSRSEDDSDMSTVTPSDQAFGLPEYRATTPTTVRIPANPSPIDLITPEQCTPHQNLKVDQRVGDAHLDGPSPMYARAMSPSPRSMLRGFGFDRIQKLPLTIDAPGPKADRLHMPAYENSILRATAEALSMPRQFKPAKMIRCVLSKERGYWYIPFIVTSEHKNIERERTFAPPPGDTDSKWPPLLKHECLTEDEFLTIWAGLDRFISLGHAGWSVRVIRRNFGLDEFTDAGRMRAFFHLQVYCFGEAIPFVYAMLLVCTRMYALCQRTRWISTVDEKIVITMTGDEVHKGALGAWSQHNDQQGRECWICH